jgi:xanthine dehydrogenase YagS FAD-binding subunit
MQAFDLVSPGGGADPARPDTAYIAGGTDMMQLMRDDILAPRRLIDLDGRRAGTDAMRGISSGPDGLRLGALATMAEVAAHPAVREQAPAISQALLLSASPQVRNMGTVGGNLLQRKRCLYFRDVGFACNKRAPGSGCPAIAGDSRELAVLGGSTHCIATHPSDMPVALMALDASVLLRAPDGGSRSVKLADFYRLPGDTPHLETVMAPGELIEAVTVPASAAARRSAYVKVRDRTSFAFALVSAAVALELRDGVIAEARLAMGGVGTRPWRMPAVEAALRGARPTEESLRAAAARATDGAEPTEANAFKVKLMPRVALRALQTVAA